MNTTWKKSLAMLLTLLFLLSPMGVGTAQETVVAAVETPPVQGEVPAPEDVGGVPSTLTLAPSAPLPGELNANASKSGSFGRVRIVEALAEGAAPVWSLARLSGDALSLSLASGTGAEASLSYSIEKHQGKVSYELTCSAGGMAQTMRIDVDVVDRPTGIAPAASQVTAGVGETIAIPQPSALPEGASFPQGTEFSVSVGGGKSVPLSGLVIDSAGEYAAEIIATCNGVTLRAPIHITVTLQTAVPVTAQGTVQQEPTPEPTVAPTPEPTSAPTQEPANTPEPTAEPTAEPGFVPGAVMADFSLPVQLRLGGESSGALGNVSYQGVLPKGARIEWALKGQQGLSFAIAASGNGVALSYSGLEDASAGAAEVSVAFTVVAEGGDTLQQGALDVAIIIIEEKQAGLEEPETPKDETEGEVTGIYMTPLKNSLEVGESTMIFATVVGDGDLDDPELEWESSDLSVLSVEQIDDGGELRARMTAEGEGTATVSAMAANGVMQTREIVVMGVAASLPISLSFSDNVPAEIDIGELCDFNQYLQYDPPTAQKPIIKWGVTTANAEINSAGILEGKGKGNVKVTAEFTNEASKTIKITSNAIAVREPLKNITIACTTAKYAGIDPIDCTAMDLKLKATLDPPTANDKTLEWISSDGSIATVAPTSTTSDINALVTLTNNGNTIKTVRITARQGNIVSDPIVINVLPAAKGIMLTPSGTAAMAPTETLALVAQILPVGATGKIKWNSSKKAVAEVDENGQVTAKSAGEAVITAKVTEAGDPAPEAFITITVGTPSLAFNDPPKEMLEGTKEQLVLSVEPKGAQLEGVRWDSSVPSAAKISASGELTAVATQDNVKTLVSADANIVTQGGKTYLHTGAHEITVFKKVTDIAVKNGTAAVTSVELYEYETLTLTAIAMASAVPVTRKLTWTSSNTAVATVDPNGKITAKGAGTTSITVSAETVGTITSKMVTVKVLAAARSVTINPPASNTTGYVVGGDRLQLSATVAPVGSPDTKLNWTVEGVNASTYVSVSPTGLVTTQNVPDTLYVTIVATTQVNGTRGTYPLIVYPTMKVFQILVGGVKKTTETVGKGGTLQLTADCTPSSRNGAVTWDSSNPAAVFVDANGQVKGLLPGTATITAKVYTWNNLLKTASITVTCKSYVETIVITGPNGLTTGNTVTSSKSITLTAKLDPPDATDRTVTWTSSDNNKATVSAAGVVTGRSVSGTVRITATAKDAGQKPGFIDIEVLPAVSSIAITSGGSTITEASLDLLISGKNKVDLTAVISPAGANPAVTWTTSNANVANVSSTGPATATVTGYAQGTASIRATAADGSGKYAMVTVKVGNAVTDITLSGPTVVGVGRSVTLSADIQPPSASIKTLKWESSNPGVATVNAAGVVTGKMAGFTYITATSTDGTGISSPLLSYRIDVYPSVTALSIYNNATNALVTTTSLDPGTANTITLRTEVSPDGATKAVTYTSSNPAVASVTANPDGTTCIVTAHSIGSAVITATATDGSNIRKTVTITCSSYVTGITISGPTEVAALKSITLTATVLPVNATNRTITWTSSNPSVATVSAAGVVTAKSASGTTTITAKAKDAGGVETFVGHAVKVIPVATGIEIRENGNRITETSLDLYTPGLPKTQLEAMIQPYDPNNSAISASQKVTWATTNANIASVDSNGWVTGYQQGTATITATATDGSLKRASVTVRVGNSVQAIVIKGPNNEDSSMVGVGRSIALVANIEPTTATIKTLKWESSNASAATVSATGVVTGKIPTAPGNPVLITATSTDGGKVVSTNAYPVHVVAAATALNLYVDDVLSTTMGVELDGTTRWIDARVTPVGAQSKCTYVSSNTTVAKVDEFGVVTGVAAGTAVITVTTTDGTNLRKTLTVTVAKLIDTITLSTNPVGIDVLGSGKTLQLIAKLTSNDPLVAPTNQACDWTSSNTNIATVSTNGLVTGRTVTTATKVTITAKAKDGSGKLATYDITVMPVATGMRIADFSGNALGSDVYVKVGQRVVLRSQIDPWNASQQATWKSSDEKIVKTDVLYPDDGIDFTPTNTGDALITATAKDGSGKSATIWVHVVKDDTPTVTVTRDGYKLGDPAARATTLGYGLTMLLKATVGPAGMEKLPVAWSSSNTAVATVDSKGLVTAGKATNNSATITATVTLNGVPVSDVHIITVAPATTSLSVYKSGDSTQTSITSLNLGMNCSETLAVKALPTGASQDVTWSTSNAGIAAVDAITGKVTAGTVKGTATITATAIDGTNKKASITVNVGEAVTGITVNGSTEMVAGKTQQLTVTFVPSNTPNKTVTWTSTNEDVATVSSTGLVTAKPITTPNSVGITATATDGSGKKNTIWIWVYASAVTTITVDAGIYGQNPADAFVAATANDVRNQLLLSANAGGRQVEWSSSNPAIAEIMKKADGTFITNGNGSDTIAVRGVKKGRTTIVAKVLDGSGKTATLSVIVQDFITSITFAASPIDMKPGQSKTLSPKFDSIYGTVTNKTVVWSSSNPSVATVDRNGLVIVNSNVTPNVGEWAEIKATATDGSGISGTIRININK